MNNRANEIRKRIERRKRERQTINRTRNRETSPYIASDAERYGGEPFISSDGGSNDSFHPLFRKEVFIFKVLLSAILVLSIGILFKNQNTNLDKARTFVTSTLENEFQFAAVTDWYEAKFGEPLALLPVNKNSENDIVNPDKYSVPATGKVLESFAVNGQGIMVETESKVVEAMDAGKVLEVANKEELGNTIVLQHADGTKTWYGNLKSIDVKLYDYVEAGQEIGEVMDEGDKKGTFYFAIKQGDTFIDPIQVIQFD